MKKFVLFLFITCLSLSLLKANTPPTGNKSLTVSATSGLSLRMAPGLSAEIITIIPNGSIVDVLECGDDILEETVEWTKGKWEYVHFEGQRGYVFDGFLTNLPLPEFDFEKIVEDMDLSYPLISWAEHRFNEVRSVDTIQRNDITKVVKVLADGVIVKKYSDTYVFRVDVELDNIRIMDAYHLLSNMMDKAERTSFNSASTFIKGNNNDIGKIKIDLEHPVTIEKIDENRVRIKIKNYNEGCSLI